MNAYKTPSSVMLLLTKTCHGKVEILLQKRKNTGFMDGCWDCSVSGHVEEDETMKQALVREAKEEIGIDLSEDILEFAGLIHEHTKATEQTYCNVYFSCGCFQGEPVINEPSLCSELQWFCINNLPDNMIPERVLAISNYLEGVYYGEHGW